MPVFRSGETPPAWCGLRHFEIVRLPAGATHRFERAAAHERLVVGAGACRLEVPGRGAVEAAEKGQGEFKFALDGDVGGFAVALAHEPVTLIRLCGRLEGQAGYGVFAPRPADGTPDRGDPVSYPKSTAFDNHFHDGDEYWIVYEGRGVAYSEGRRYEVGPGDCVATGMGHHHDFTEIHEPVRAVFFETSLEGQQRPGHLWEHAHGPASPRWERM
jgi:mannose-6-phosphate isomerase-like protein (cupin superfamily)